MPNAGAARTAHGGVHRERAGRASDVGLADQVAALKSLLGPRLMAVTIGVDLVTVDRWIAGQTKPRLENEKRIHTAYQIYDLLKPVDASPTIRAWFMGMNPQLEDRSPSEAIAEGDLRAVLAAARAFLAGG